MLTPLLILLLRFAFVPAHGALSAVARWRT
jgi:hypothetical protein